MPLSLLKCASKVAQRAGRRNIRAETYVYQSVDQQHDCIAWAPVPKVIPMTKIYYESDAQLSVLDGQRLAVVGYGNQGRSWALNLRDSGLPVEVFTRADASRDQAEAEGFTAHEIAAASECDVICTLIPDDIIPELPITPKR